VHRILIELSDGTAEPLDDEPSGIRESTVLAPRPLARRAPEPRPTTERRMRGHLRALPRVA
jgi:hypothetical protein